MGIEFRPSDYFAPVALLRLHRTLDRSQWWPPEALRNWQLQRLQVVVDRTYPLSEAAAAHAYIESRHAFGRVVLIP